MNFTNILDKIDFQNKVQWIMLFPVFPHISPYITECVVPSYRFDTDSDTKAITGFSFLEDISITFQEDQDGTVQLFLGTLEALTWDRDTKVFRDNQALAKQFAYLTMDEIDPSIPTLGWRFFGLRYKGMDTLSFSNTGDGVLNITAHFSVDQIQPTFKYNNWGLLPTP